MEKYNSGLYLKEEDDQVMELPPGFRFHPTDEELVTHYLFPKVRDGSFVARAIGEVDLNKSEPWELPWRAKMGEKEWYFFCLRDRKYPTGLRTNRATEAGYWKATGKDKEIYRMKVLVGMKKTLVFYKGRAPKGEKTNWVMHEYRLEGNYSSSNLPKSEKNEWVICRTFEKNSSGKKTDITELAGYASKELNIGSSQLPPLMDSSPYTVRNPRSLQGDSSQVSSFSNLLMKNQVPKLETLDNFDSLLPVSYPSNPSSFTFPSNYSKPNLPSASLSTQVSDPIENWSHHDSEQSILRLLLDNQGPSLWSSKQPEYSQESGLSTDMSPNLSNREMDQVNPSTTGGPVDIDCLWTY